MDPWEIAEAVPDAFTAPLPEPVAEEAEARRGQKSGRPRKEPAIWQNGALRARARAEAEGEGEDEGARAGELANAEGARPEAKAAAEEAPPSASRPKCRPIRVVWGR